MSNNIDKKNIKKYNASLTAWNELFHDRPNEINLTNEIESIYTCLEKIKSSQLKKLEKIELILVPIGLYSNEGKKIKNYSFSGKKVAVKVVLHKGDIKSFLKRRYSSCKELQAVNYSHYNYCKLKFFEKIYKKVIEIVYSQYEYELHNNCNWYTCTMEQYQFQKNRTKKQYCQQITQKKQGKILEKLLDMSIYELTEKIELSSFLEKIHMNFIEFQKIYMEKNSMKL